MSAGLEELRRRMEEKRLALAAATTTAKASSTTAQDVSAAASAAPTPATSITTTPAETPLENRAALPTTTAATTAQRVEPAPPASVQQQQPPQSSTTAVTVVTPTVETPSCFVSPPTSRPNHHSSLSARSATTARSFAHRWLQNPSLLQAVKRIQQQRDDAERANDISISRKKARKETTSGSNSNGDDNNNHSTTTSGSGASSTTTEVAGHVDWTCASRPCGTVDEYSNSGKLSEGVYGVVYKGFKEVDALNPSTGKLQKIKQAFALKLIKSQWLKESQVGFPPYLLRELDLTMRIHHPNVIHTVEIVCRTEDNNINNSKVTADAAGTTATATTGERECSTPTTATATPTATAAMTVGGVYAVMDYAWRDLKSFLYETKTPFLHLSKRNAHPQAEEVYIAKAKCVAKQLFEGLAFLHRHRILHRDLKTSNVLVTADGVARICDLGLSRFIRRREHLTPTVVTLMYRAPELHLGITDYDDALDVWSAGCILAELFLKQPLFRAEAELEHCARVCRILGYPTDDVFPGVFLKPEAVAILTQSTAITPLTNSTTTTHTTETSTSTTATTDEAEVSVVGGGNASVKRFLTHEQETSYRGAKIIPPQCIDLLSRIFQWNPKDRPSAEEALKHPFFTEELPAAALPAQLVKPMPFAVAVPPRAPSPQLGAKQETVAIDETVLTETLLSTAITTADGGRGEDGMDEQQRLLIAQAQLEDEEEQEEQAHNVRDTSPEAAAHRRLLAVDDESRNITPLLVPLTEDQAYVDDEQQPFSPQQGPKTE